MTWRSSPNRRKLVAIGTQNAVGAQISVNGSYKILPNGSALGTLKRLINAGGPVSEATLPPNDLSFLSSIGIELARDRDHGIVGLASDTRHVADIIPA
jgi:hypothetical protein